MVLGFSICNTHWEMLKASGSTGEILKAWRSIVEMLNALGSVGELLNTLGMIGEILKALESIGEMIKALGRSNIRVRETEWRKQEALLCMNSWKIDSIPSVGGKGKLSHEGQLF